MQSETIKKVKRVYKKLAWRIILWYNLRIDATIWFRRCNLRNDVATQRPLHVESTLIRLEYYVNTLNTKFRRISKSLPRPFFNVISMVEKFAWFPHTLFHVILMVEKSAWFPRIFFDIISIVEKSTLFPRTFFDVILMVKWSTFFARTFFDKISMNLRSLLRSCKLMKTFEEVFLCYPARRQSITILRLPRRVEDILQDILQASWRRLRRRKIVTLKTSWRRLEDMSWRRLDDMSWRCLEEMSWRRLEDIMETNKILTGDICI